MMTGEARLLEYVAPWPSWVSILLILACALTVFTLYARESSDVTPRKKFLLATIRLSLVGIVLWMMYGAVERPFRTDLPDLLLVVDDSKSMSTVDVSDEPKLAQRVEQDIGSLDLTESTRLNRAKSLLLRNDASLLRFLDQNYQLKASGLESEASSGLGEVDLVTWLLAVAPTNEQSRLGETLRSRLRQRRGRPVAAVVFMTDGILTDGPLLSEVAQEAKRRKIPLHIVGLGSQTPARDVKLNDLVTNDVAFVGDLITFDFTMSATGYANETVNVSLRRVDEQEILASRRIELASEKEVQPVRLTLEATEKGEFDYVIEAAADTAEATVDNNQLSAHVEVRDEKTRVLLVQAYANYEYHYLRTLLQRAAEEKSGASRFIELSVLLQEADPQFVDIDEFAIRNFPSRDELFEYDVCIFGDVNPGFLTQASLRDLRDFVLERGRGFVGMAGPRYFPMAYANTPLAEVLPFEFADLIAPPSDLPIDQGFHPVLTELGQQMPAMQLSTDALENAQHWQSLSELYWLLETSSLKMGVRTLLEHSKLRGSTPAPVVTLSYAGAGKVLFHFTDESWRWRIGHGDKYFSRYWHQAILYLSRFKLGEGRDVELTTDRKTYNQGEVVRVRARFFDDRLAPSDDQGVVIAIERSGAEQQQVRLTRDPRHRGSFSGDVAGLRSGSFHAWMFQPTLDAAPPSTDFRMVVPDTELTRLRVDTAEMKEAAKVSGGRFYTYATASELGESLPVGRRVRMESLTPKPVWNSWPVALTFVVMLTTEWLLRRQFGMV